MHAATDEATEVLRPARRLDHHGSIEFSRQVEACDRNARPHLVLDLSGVEYISSAALRVLVLELKHRQAAGGSVTLAAPRPYVLNVLRISGMESTLRVVPDLASAGGGAAAPDGASEWSAAESFGGDWGRMRVLAGSPAPTYIEVAGDIEDVLRATVSPEHVFSKQFSHKAYSIGLGGLGEQLEDYYTLMGEMMTVGGSMVWLPCDGHGVPDFLIPKNDAGQVLMRSGFNASLAGQFNEYVAFEAARPEGLSIAQLYRLLFDQARRRRPEFKGAIGLAMRCQMPALFGAGVVRAPVLANRPENALPITDPSNFSAWFEFDREPRHREVTGLVVGVGVDLSFDLSGYTTENFRRTFYINPANREASDMSLHNHVVAFDPLPMPAEGCSLESEIAHVLDEGRFRDMRHLLDASTVSRAVIGVMYVQDFRNDPEVLPGHARGEGAHARA